MDNYSADDVQNVNDEAAHVVTDCLLNPLVVRNIMECLPSKELRKLSLVNKLWKCEARSVMRKRGQLMAYIKSTDLEPCNPFEEVDAFISDLKQTDLFPFTGISIRIYFDPEFSPIQIAAQDELEASMEGVFFDQPSLKTVSVRLGGSWFENVSSPGVLLAKKVLQDSNGFLEELELGMEEGQEYFLEKFVQDRTFPRLQILKLRELNFLSDDAGYENYMKAILSRAPNLKVLHSNWSVNVLLKVLEGSSVIPVYGSATAPFEDISENVFSAIKFEHITFEYTGPEFDLQRLNRIAPKLLQQSCTTIHSVLLDAVLAVPLMTFGMQLENVKDLYMEIAYDPLELIEPRILRIVKNFDFSRIFPNLNKIRIGPDNVSVHDLSQDHMNAIISRANAVLREPMPDRAARIKEMVLHYHDISSAAAQFYVEMFPNIEKLEIITSRRGQISFEPIWNWLELKEFKVRGDVLPTTGNLDSFFCGIFPEEVAELRLKDDEYLKRVHIVPVMPAVTCVKNLRTLSLHHEHHRRDPFGDDETFIFSAVTVLLAFARLPDLAVSLKICAKVAAPAMPHLEPYVSVSSELRDDVHW